MVLSQLSSSQSRRRNMGAWIILCVIFSQIAGSLALSGRSLFGRQGIQPCNGGEQSCAGSEICCPIGSYCTPQGCCPEGQHCQSLSSDPCIPGKSDITCIKCPSDDFSCPLTRICSRDSSGRPQCLMAPTIAPGTSTRPPATSIVTGTASTSLTGTTVVTPTTASTTPSSSTNTGGSPTATGGTSTAPGTPSATTSSPSATTSGSSNPSSEACGLISGSSMASSIIAVIFVGLTAQFLGLN